MASNMRQHSECVSMSGLHTGEDRTSIFRSGRDNRTLVRFPHIFHTPYPFHPPNRRKIVAFSDGFFVPDVRKNGASSAPNRMSESRTVWPQLTIRTHARTHSMTAIADHFIEMIC
jgi:hypothetical protein